MHSLPILTSLPKGTVVEESERGVLALDGEYAAVLGRAGLAPESGPRTTESDLVGRRPLREIVTPEGVFVVRSYIHGGLARWVTGERFADPERPFRELVTSHALGELGITTPRVVAARARKAPVGGWYLDLVSLRVPGLLSLTRLIASVDRGEKPVSLLHRIAEATGRLVSSFHEHGFLHADLTTENVLLFEESLQEELPRFCTLDLDRSVFRSDLGDVERRANLHRLHRCIVRRTSHAHNVSVARLCARFMRGYEPVLAKRKADWTALAKLAKRSRAFHSLGWSMERAVGQSRSAAEKGITSLPGSQRTDSGTQTSD